MTEAKHANYVRVLKLRAASENFKDNLLTDKDYLSVKEVFDYANENNDEFLFDEMKKHPCLEEIYKGADEVLIKVKNEEKQADMQEFARDIELEFERADSRVAKLKAKAEKSGKAFDENEVRRKAVSKMRYLRYFSDESLKNYTDFNSVNNNLEFVFETVTALSQSK